jgi:hypothetical protein
MIRREVQACKIGLEHDHRSDGRPTKISIPAQYGGIPFSERPPSSQSINAIGILSELDVMKASSSGKVILLDMGEQFCKKKFLAPSSRSVMRDSC